MRQQRVVHPNSHLSFVAADIFKGGEPAREPVLFAADAIRQLHRRSLSFRLFFATPEREGCGDTRTKAGEAFAEQRLAYVAFESRPCHATPQWEGRD